MPTQVDTLSEDGCTAVYYSVLGRHPQVTCIILIIIIAIVFYLVRKLEVRLTERVRTSRWKRCYCNKKH